MNLQDVIDGEYLERHNIHGALHMILRDMIEVRPSQKAWTSFVVQRLQNLRSSRSTANFFLHADYTSGSSCEAERRRYSTPSKEKTPALGRAYRLLCEARLNSPETISDALSSAFNVFVDERVGRAPLVSDYISLLGALLQSTWRKRVSNFDANREVSKNVTLKDATVTRFRRLLVPRHLAAFDKPDFSAMPCLSRAVQDSKKCSVRDSNKSLSGEKASDPLLDAVLEGSKLVSASDDYSSSVLVRKMSRAEVNAGEGCTKTLLDDYCDDRDGVGGSIGGDDAYGDRDIYHDRTKGFTTESLERGGKVDSVRATYCEIANASSNMTRERDPISFQPLAVHYQTSVQFVVFAAGLRAALLCRQFMKDVRKAFTAAGARLKDNGIIREGDDRITNENFAEDSTDVNMEGNEYIKFTALKQRGPGYFQQGSTNDQQQQNNVRAIQTADTREAIHNGRDNGVNRKSRSFISNANDDDGQVIQPTTEIGAFMRALPERWVYNDAGLPLGKVCRYNTVKLFMAGLLCPLLIGTNDTSFFETKILSRCYLTRLWHVFRVVEIQQIAGGAVLYRHSLGGHVLYHNKILHFPPS